MARAGVILQRVRSLLGEDTVVETRADAPPVVLPRTTDACALVLQMAAAEGWKVSIEGARSWSSQSAPADLAVSTRGLHRTVAVSATDLIATVDAGIPWGALRQTLADQGAWLATDPPGASRTLGSVIATGTSGPLRNGFGSLRDHLLGITIVTGDGRIVHPGGRVVKNVAGFDLTRLAAGSFGAFGIITSAHLRLRSVPRADATLLASGDRDDLVEIALRIMEAGETPAALELLSPGAVSLGTWVLAVRVLGSESAVEEARRAASVAAGGPLTELKPAEAGELWSAVTAGPAAFPTTLRIGALSASLPDALDLLAHHLDDGWVSATVGAGAIRWSGAATAERIRLLRHAGSQREFPVTVERAPWEILEPVGHFGAYREGVGRLVSSLRRVFDPRQVLAAPAESR